MALQATPLGRSGIRACLVTTLAAPGRPRTQFADGTRSNGADRRTMADGHWAPIVSIGGAMCKAVSVSATYVAWNGQSYPSPPPDGWYEASDGRWWAPGTGPGTTAQNPAVSAPSDEVEHRPTIATEALATTEITPPHGEQQTVLNGPRSGGTSQERSPVPGDLPSATAATAATATADDGIWQPIPEKSSERSKTMLIAVGAGALLLIVALLALLGLTGGDDDDTETGVADRTTSANANAGTNSGTGSDGDSDPDGQGSGATSATSQTESSETSAAQSTTTVPATTATSLQADIDTTTDAEKIERFRAILDDNGLSGDLLNDDDLLEFGTSFCIFATATDDFDDYVAFRQEAIAESGSELTEDELTVAVDGAVTSFCPAEAARLGLTG